MTSARQNIALILYSKARTLYTIAMPISDHVTIIPVLGDNFVYLYRYDEDGAIAIDCGHCASVLRVLEKENLNLSAILVTHEHFDHTAGVSELRKQTGCDVISSASDGDVLSFGNEKIQIIATPGHTVSSICFYRMPSKADKQGLLFTGDTLFAGGCGRIFECSAATMHQSLQKLAALPEDTLVYPGHDYTMENYQFALTTESANDAIKHRLEDIKRLQSEGKATIPSTIAQERETNVFLLAKTEKDFAKLRKRKDAF